MKIGILFLIFVFIISPICSAEVDFSVMNLWTEKSTSAGGFFINLTEEKNDNNQSVNANVNFSKIGSNLDYLKGDLFFCEFDFVYKHQMFESKSQFIIPTFNDLFLSVKEKDFLFNEAFNGIGFLQSFSIIKNHFQISPYFQYTFFPSSSGAFHWFSGKIGIPKVVSTGLNFYISDHQINFLYTNAKINVLNDIDVAMGNLFGNNFFAEYKYNFNANQFLFSLFAGCGAFWGNLDLTLTKENQKFLLFPYNFYDCKGKINAQYVLFGCDFSYSNNNFGFELNSIVGFCLNQNGTINLDWKYKKNLFFNGSSGSKQTNIDFFNKKGVILLDVNTFYNFSFFSRPSKIYLEKTFVIPLSNTSTSIDVESELNYEKVMSLIFSGLKLGITIK